MSLARAELPTDPTALRAFALACQDELRAAELAVQYKTLEIEKLKFQIAKLRRMQFGRSSERINHQIAQLELRLEALESEAAEDAAKAEAAEPAASARIRNKPTRKPLPDHLPRQEVVHQPADDGACTCPACGRGMSKLGEDITEVLDYVPGHFQVIRHVRPKYACDACDAITQAAAPAMPTPRGRACWRICWWQSTATTCRCIARPRSMPERDWISTARPCATGLAKRPGCSIRSPPGSSATSSPARRSMATTPRSRCWRRGSAGPKPGGCGSMCAMIGHSAAKPLRLPLTSTAPTAAASARRHTWLGLPASSRPTATPGSRRCTIPLATSRGRSSRLPAGRIADARSSTCGSRRSRRSPRRRSTASPRSMSSRTRPGSR